MQEVAVPRQKAESRKLKAEIIGSVSLKAQEKNLSGKMWKDAERSGTRRKTGDRSWEIGTKVSGCLNSGQSQVGGYDLDSESGNVPPVVEIGGGSPAAHQTGWTVEKKKQSTRRTNDEKVSQTDRTSQRKSS